MISLEDIKNQTKTFQGNKLFINVEKYEISKEDGGLKYQPIKNQLTYREFNVFLFLVGNKREILSREQIINACGLGTIKGRSVSRLISNIRKKLELTTKGELIVTHRGKGYECNPNWWFYTPIWNPYSKFHGSGRYA